MTPDVPITLDERGSGRPALVLHGGGGVATVAPIAAHLAQTMRALTPTHPGWDGTPRPDDLDTVAELAAVYLDLLAARGLRDVALVGSSVGGWIAAEMAVRDAGGSIVGPIVLIDSMGIAVDGAPIRDFFALNPREVIEYSFHDFDRFYVDPADTPPEQAEAMRANLETLRVYAGDPYMHDPGLRDRLAAITAPALVVWGDSDRIATPEYGRAFAASIPGARFELIADAGHLPQLEQPAATFAVIDPFVAAMS